MFRLSSTVIALVFCAAGFARAQTAAPSPAEKGLPKVGILLDTSPEMGFLVPQVRKELRLLDEELIALGREPMPIRELKGAALDREVTLSIPARLNALHSIRALYGEEKVDTVYWISALKGFQSVGGYFDLEKEIGVQEEGRPPRKLIIRNIWQEQLQRSAMSLRRGFELEGDPLELKERPDAWYRLVNNGRGYIMRSWQAPPAGFRKQFGFPWRVNHVTWLRKAGYEGRTAEFDMEWSRDLFRRHGLHFVGAKEEWPYYFNSYDWIHQGSLLPFPDEATSPDRDEKLFSELFRRDSIEKDLAAIEAKKLGVLFAFGYVKQDLAKYSRNENRGHLFGRFIADTIALVRETRQHTEKFQERSTADEQSARVYATQLIELNNQHVRPKGPDAVAKKIAEMVREEGVDAIYLFTNGYSGGHRYGICTLDEELLELAVREAGAKLYIRMPFETCPAPISLEQLALASGGKVFRGTQEDPDWKRELPTPAWPGGEMKEEESGTVGR
jgi:hypothetical protein